MDWVPVPRTPADQSCTQRADHIWSKGHRYCLMCGLVDPARMPHPKAQKGVLPKGTQPVRIRRNGFVVFMQQAHGLWCWYCLIPLKFEDVTIDHATPKVRGGPKGLSNWSNLRIACRACNHTKADMTEDEFRASPQCELRQRASARTVMLSNGYAE